MALTPAQQTTLKADILAQAPLAADVAASNYFNIWLWYTQPSSFIVWRTSVGIDEIMQNGFVWTAVDALTAGKARIWDWMTKLGTINPSKANVRQGMADCFGAGSAMATAITPHLKRTATQAERLFATGTGTDATPGLLTLEGGFLEVSDVENALRS